eukprot:MONOS_12660.1-p1 / transcript=MONOS_12660.1 / gene=MONOS_12660 / organism=Monocercomonoides_exilis_PA203 / gene_product=Uncharacterized protein Reut_A2532 / transcript_product=Uncharacterized protein Reut_A2532 / location=Mono_scaffold00716:694-1730(+) / protein_length=329 / sequence_SO=supercontig / SO=protein_coding / is_pseudo=false
MIFEEEKKEEKNEKLLVDLCECYLLLGNQFNSELIFICVPCLLKAASKKEESEEAQKEAELALLALNNIAMWKFIEQKLYLKEIKEIIEYHQEHHNLTRLAYQSAWQFLMDRLNTDSSLEGVIVNELHFAREAASELEELMICADWKKKKEMSKKEAKEVLIIRRWIQTLSHFFEFFRLWNKEFGGIFGIIVKVFRAARDNQREICDWCICSLRNAAKNRAVKVEDLLKGKAIDTVLEEIHRPTLNDGITNECLRFFMNISRRLKRKTDDEKEEARRKATKRKISEKMEEEGYEDAIISFYEILNFLNDLYFFSGKLSLDISDYFMII